MSRLLLLRRDRGDTGRWHASKQEPATPAGSGPDQDHLVLVCRGRKARVELGVDDTALRRLANIAENPQVALLADHYAENWGALWWVRADGTARVLTPEGKPELRSAAIRSLAARYEPYQQRPLEGPLIMIAVSPLVGLECCLKATPGYPENPQTHVTH